jgi:thioredoxin reductase (NADPH)
VSIADPELLTTENAFPHLDAGELQRVRKLAEVVEVEAGQVVYEAGQSRVDLYFVESGRLRIMTPDGQRVIAEHGPGQFAGDVDLLTRRPAIYSVVASKPSRLLRVPNAKVRDLLNTVPSVGEKIMVAIQLRRELIKDTGHFGVQVIGDKTCHDTNLIREFLHKNFVPFDWHDAACDAKADRPEATPIVQCGDQRLVRPSLRKLAEVAGIWQACPIETVDLAIVGGGPAGITAAVYAASEGLSTVVLDRLGPGGQAGGSSRIENFIGFPAGLSGTDLATRGVLQMLKFGARIVAPVDVVEFEVGEDGKPHGLHLDCGGVLRAHAVLVATGVAWRRLEAKNAKEFERAGVYYACTAIEARLHEGQDVAVVGGGNSAGQAAMFLSQDCAKKVHLLLRSGDLSKSMSDYLAARIKANPQIQVHTGAQIEEVLGEDRITGVKLKRTGEGPTELSLSGIFVFIGAEPHSRWLPSQVVRDERQYVLTGFDLIRRNQWPLKDRDPCPLETSLPGLLVAGDVRAGSTKRVGFAVGDGALAVTCVHQLRAADQGRSPASA